MADNLKNTNPSNRNSLQDSTIPDTATGSVGDKNSSSSNSRDIAGQAADPAIDVVSLMGFKL